MAEDSRRRGRPPVGPRVAVRLSPSVLSGIDATAHASGESRASTVRRLLEEALQTRTPDGVDRAQIRRMLALTPRERIRHMADVANRVGRLRKRAQGGR